MQLIKSHPKRRQSIDLLPIEIHNIIIKDYLNMYCHSCNKNFTINQLSSDKLRPIRVSNIISCCWKCYYEYGFHVRSCVFGNGQPEISFRKT